MTPLTFVHLSYLRPATYESPEYYLILIIKSLEQVPLPGQNYYIQYN
jgi:hypothetical protein